MGPSKEHQPERRDTVARVSGGGFEYGKDGPATVVAGVDGSESSLNALAFAVGVARRQHARLQVVLVSPYTSGLPDPSGTFEDDRVASTAETVSWLAQTTCRACVELDVDIDIVLRYGDPCREILSVATDLHADQIIVGASTSWSHRYLGGLGARLQRHSQAPVTVVP